MNPSISEALLTTLGENFLHISEAAEVGVLSEAMISRLMEQKKEVIASVHACKDLAAEEVVKK